MSVENSKQEHVIFAQKVEDAKQYMQDAKKKAQDGVTAAQKEVSSGNDEKHSTSTVKEVTTEHEVKVVNDGRDDVTHVVNKSNKTPRELQLGGEGKDVKVERKVALPGSSKESISLVDAAKQN